MKTEKEVRERLRETENRILYLKGELNDMSRSTYESDTLKTLFAHFQVEEKLLKWILDKE